VQSVISIIHVNLSALLNVMDRYEYIRLNPENEEIRLICLLAGSFLDDIEVEIFYA
jgi:hypothetical protein